MLISVCCIFESARYFVDGYRKKAETLSPNSMRNRFDGFGRINDLSYLFLITEQGCDPDLVADHFPTMDDAGLKRCRQICRLNGLRQNRVPSWSAIHNPSYSFFHASRCRELYGQTDAQLTRVFLIDVRRPGIDKPAPSTWQRHENGNTMLGRQSVLCDGIIRQNDNFDRRINPVRRLTAKKCRNRQVYALFRSVCQRLYFFEHVGQRFHTPCPDGMPFPFADDSLRLSAVFLPKLRHA